MPKTHQLAEVVVEATDLLEDLARGIRDGLPADPAVDTAAEAVDEIPQPRFRNPVLNKLDSQVRTAEETVRRELEAQVAAKVRKTRVDTARTLCGQISGLLDQLSAAEDAAPAPAEAATSAGLADDATAAIEG